MMDRACGRRRASIILKIFSEVMSRRHSKPVLHSQNENREKLFSVFVFFTFDFRLKCTAAKAERRTSHYTENIDDDLMFGLVIPQK